MDRGIRKFPKLDALVGGAGEHELDGKKQCVEQC